MSAIKRVVVFGGTGFVGCQVIHALVARRMTSAPALEQIVSLTRRGAAPAHFANQPQLHRPGPRGGEEKSTGAVQWLSADAADVGQYEHLFNAETAVVITNGSPPLPTMSAEAQEAQRKANGGLPTTIIEAAARNGVKRLALVNAAMPSWTPAGYRQGKLDALNAARDFCADPANPRDAVVLQPSAIYGTRHTANGYAIPLAPVLYPASAVLSALGAVGITGALEKAAPSVFAHALTPFVPVEAVGEACAAGVLSPRFESKGLTLVSAAELGDAAQWKSE